MILNGIEWNNNVWILKYRFQWFSLPSALVYSSFDLITYPSMIPKRKNIFLISK